MVAMLCQYARVSGSVALEETGVKRRRRIHSGNPAIREMPLTRGFRLQQDDRNRTSIIGVNILRSG